MKQVFDVTGRLIVKCRAVGPVPQIEVQDHDGCCRMLLTGADGEEIAVIIDPLEQERPVHLKVGLLSEDEDK